MSKFIIDSMLPKYHHPQQYPHQLLSPVITSGSNSGLVDSPVVNYSLTNNSSSSSSSPPPSLVSPASRMYPYVAASAAAAHHHQQQAAAAAAFASGGMVPGAFTSPSSAALAAVVDAATAGDKSCRYPSNVPSAADSMVNYALHHHQNGATANSASAASASMAAFYHQAAAASVGADPLNSCSSQVNAGAGQPMPDIPRYPWMSITGK
ncbi:hypothetical protein V9T40_004480 [Parthenolecanium corni]|uniref:Abdominal-A n=1 Tax=Parthenolecanium corni TaxID=536013 RepID=A0AAN9TSS3_9HEMI